MIEDLLIPYICPRFLSDEHYHEWSVAILAPKPGTIVLGLHTPEIKMLAKEFVKSGKWEDLCAEFGKRVPKREGEPQELCQEERTIWGLMLDYVKVDVPTRFALIKSFLPAIDNWAICDTFCCNSAWVEKEDKESVWEFIEELYAVNPNDKDYEFTLKASICRKAPHITSVWESPGCWRLPLQSMKSIHVTSCVVHQFLMTSRNSISGKPENQE